MTDFVDIVEGASIRRTHDSYEAVRSFLFNGLSGSASARCIAALERPVTPRIGDPHPDVVGILCLDIEARARDTQTVEVTATYSIPQATQEEPDEQAPGTTEVGASVQQVTTQKDANGDVIVVEHVADVAQVSDLTADLPRRKQGASVNVQIPQPVLRLTRRERFAPWGKALEFVGKVNSINWNDGNARTWLCVNINGVTNDGGDSYEVSYEFQYNPETWDATIVYRDPETGKPPGDVVEQLDVGIPTIVTKQIYQTIDFGRLNVRF